MNVAFDILFTILFSHNYYTDKKFKKFRVVPFPETNLQFRKLGLVFKTYNDGFAVLYDRKFAGSDRERKELVKLKRPFRFSVFNEDPFLLNYTDGLTDYRMNSSILYFTNTRADENSGRLHDGDHVRKSAIKNNIKKSAPGVQGKPFGIISISPQKLTDGNYSIHFNARATIWRYILATDFLQGLEKPAIINKEDNSVFSGPTGVMLPDKRPAMLFTSNHSIELSDRFNRRFQLVENFTAGNGKYKVVLQQLPYPDIRGFSVIDEAGGSSQLFNYSEIII